MSRSSRKSELSPSATGSNIDLGKNDGVDMGRKAQPSVTSGELGVSTEITNIGGVSVTGGVSVDISPIDLGINYDPSENSVSVASGAEIPGGLLGVSGGLTVDLDTGEIIGGSVGGEVAGLGVNVSASKDGGLGVELTVQIPFTPIEFSVGFGFPPKKKEPIPTPAPEPPSSPGDGSDGGRFSAEDLEKIDPRDTIYVVGICKGVILLSDLARKILIQGTWYLDFNTNKATGRPTLGKIRAGLWWNGWRWNISRASYDWEDNPPPRLYYAKYNNQHSYQLIGLSHLPEVGEWVETNTHVHANFSYAVMSGEDFKASLTAEVQPSTLCPGGFPRWVRIEKYSPKGSTEDNPPRPFNEIYRPPTNTPDSPPPPFPNPPLRKQNKMDTCCQENLKFLRAIYTGLGISKFPGKLPATIIQEVSQEGEEPPEPPQVPIKDFVDLLTWQFERDDERWGQWEIQIDIKDSDITKEGDQKKSVKFPNLAESVAELEGQI